MMKMLKIVFVLLMGLVSSSAQAMSIQEASNWCWAASIQDIFYQKGYQVSQPQIVQRMFGMVVDRPATLAQIQSFLNAQGVRTGWVASIGSPQELYTTLYNGAKVIAFVNPANNPYVGHFVVFEGIDAYGRVVVADPANGQTQGYSLEDVYYGWKWQQSLVVF